MKMQETKTKPTLRTVTCSFCKRLISYDPTVISMGKAIMDHKQTEHREEMEKLRLFAVAMRHQKAQERKQGSQSPQGSPQNPQGSPQGSQDGSQSANVQSPKGDGLQVATSAEAANVFVIRPQKYDINSLFILIAKHICENEWKWPEMSVSQWLDSYLFHTMRQRGYVIGAYQKSEVSDGRH